MEQIWILVERGKKMTDGNQERNNVIHLEKEFWNLVAEREEHRNFPSEFNFRFLFLRDIFHRFLEDLFVNVIWKWKKSIKGQRIDLLIK